MTSQTPDTIHLDGESWLLLATPLDQYLAEAGLREWFVAPNTANWRGYVAGWRVDEGGRLFLDEITATVRGPGSEIRTVRGSAVLRGVSLPMPATFVSGRFRAARGDQMSHVHSGFDSSWAEEMLLDVDRGRLRTRVTMAPPSAKGRAGPYQLHEPLLSGLSGGGFGEVVTATDLDGRPVVAKLPRPRAGAGHTERWLDTPAGPRPAHLPAQVFRGDSGVLRPTEVGLALTTAILHREADLLERDGGRLLPRSLGLWPHHPSGFDTLVMERLIGESPSRAVDVLAVLEALADAVDRGTFDAHGDVKPEHVFIADGIVRMCDPAPRFDDPEYRGLTPAYNPRAWTGAAADVAACAVMLRYLPTAAGDGHPGWRWCAAVLDEPTPPAWSTSHRAALTELRRDLTGPPAFPPPGWSVPAMPTMLASSSDPQARAVTIPLRAGVGGRPPGAVQTPWPAPPITGPLLGMGHAWGVLALVFRASVIEPVDLADGGPGAVFVPASEHAANALDAIITAVSTTVAGSARRFGVSLCPPPAAPLKVRRVTHHGRSGFVAHPSMSPPVGAAGADDDTAPSFVASARAALAGMRMAETCRLLESAVQRLELTPDPQAASGVVAVAQEMERTLTILRGHVGDALPGRQRQ
ncbi:hypothetical protein [Nakamurella sp.]|uniref:hypothetical protein n=1 Tax=Nakamurella sp. TaxID=1869182 RepID=UPI003B3ACED0